MFVIIVNGYPEAGKDEFVGMAGEKYKIYHHSTIDRCKEIARFVNWNGVKDDKSRLMLSDLKKWYIKYFDGVFVDFTERVKRCKAIGIDFLFVVSREPEEINRISRWCYLEGIDCKYVFVRRGEPRLYGNSSDDNVLKGLEPDIYLNNNGSLDDFRESVNDLLSGILSP